jgi:hypothetical protein
VSVHKNNGSERALGGERKNCSRLVSGGGAIVIVWKVGGIDFQTYHRIIFSTRLNMSIKMEGGRTALQRSEIKAALKNAGLSRIDDSILSKCAQAYVVFGSSTCKSRLS